MMLVIACVSDGVVVCVKDGRCVHILDGLVVLGHVMFH